MEEKDSQQEKVDVLFKLAEGDWIEFDSRRVSAWKINLSLWAGLAVMTGFVIKENVHTPCVWTIIFFSLLAACYLYFQIGLHNSNTKNQTNRHHYLNQIHILANITKPIDFDKKPKTSNKVLLFNWYIGVIITTLMLFVTSCYFLIRCC